MSERLETYGRIETRAFAERLSARYAGQDAEAVLRAAIRAEFEGRIAVVSSFGADSAVLLHLVARIDPYVPVIFLDTGKHFPETLAYRDTLVRRVGLCNIQTLHPRPRALAADDPDGLLHKRNPDLCCHIRKTQPMLQGLRGLKCWITGRKRGQTADRAGLTLFEPAHPMLKLNPLLDWTAEDLAAHVARHDLPVHPLVPQGYPSIGCSVCTRAVRPGEDPRAGRWSDSDKTECGIHFENGKLVRRGPAGGGGAA